jgi:hypothetical protein
MNQRNALTYYISKQREYFKGGGGRRTEGGPGRLPVAVGSCYLLELHAETRWRIGKEKSGKKNTRKKKRKFTTMWQNFV